MYRLIFASLLGVALIFLAGCNGVTVNKSVNLNFDSAAFTAGAQPFIDAPGGGEGEANAAANVGDTNAEATAAGSSAGQASGRQHGLVNVIVVNASDTQAELQDALKAAIEGKFAVTGQGSAGVSGNAGGPSTGGNSPAGPNTGGGTTPTP